MRAYFHILMIGLLASSACSSEEKPEPTPREYTSGAEALTNEENERMAALVQRQEQREQEERLQSLQEQQRLLSKGALRVQLESHCAYGYHLMAKDPTGTQVVDDWIDRERQKEWYLLPGTKLYFCGQYNECPDDAFYTVPSGNPGQLVRVFCPCSEAWQNGS